jgi:hypothetical protein
MEQVQLLKQEVTQYSIVDNQIKELNKQLALLREQKSVIEDRMTVILSSPQFVAYDKLSVGADNTIINFKRPGWIKPWSLSRGNLRQLVYEYFRATDPADLSSTGCCEFIFYKF